MQALVKLASALADETRLRIVQDLLEGEATVSDLGARLALAQPRVSTHLKILYDAGLVTVEAIGRQRTYRVDGPRAAQLLAALRALVPAGIEVAPRSKQAGREVQHNTLLRQARTCYGHLAGVAGVRLLDECLKRHWLTPASVGGRIHYELTPEGARALTRRGVDIDDVRNAHGLFAYGCPDWTERRPHLAGALGTAMFRALQTAGVVRRTSTARAVRLLHSLPDWFNAAGAEELRRVRQHRIRRAA